jgi:hypothetical protein
MPYDFSFLPFDIWSCLESAINIWMLGFSTGIM